jgi:hypothetical protein
LSRNGSGTFTLVAGNPVSSGTTISSTWANNTLSDIASALTQSVSKDGQTTWTGNMPAGGYKITGLANGSAATDSATLGQVQAGAVTLLGGVAGTVDVITATTSPAITGYAAGQAFRFVSTGANTGAVTLNLNGLGAKAVTKQGTTALAAGDIPSSAVAEVVYDGTQFQLINVGSLTPTLTSITLGSGANSTTVTATTDTRTSSTTAVPTATVTNTTTDAASASLITRKSRSAGDTASSDALYAFTHQGYANSAYRTAVTVSIVQDGAISGSTVPGAWVLSNQAAGGSFNENLRVDSTGRVLLAGSTAAANYTARGDVTLPATGGVRAKNTIKAWVTFDGTGAGPITPLASFNVTNITKNGTGDYTINFTNSLANADYCVVGMCGDAGTANARFISGPRTTAPSTSSFRITVSDGAPILRDAPYIYVMVVGD